MDRFFRYLAMIEKSTQGTAFKVTPQSVKDYLAYLAIKEKVAATTQNQAFKWNPAQYTRMPKILRFGLRDERVRTEPASRRGHADGAGVGVNVEGFDAVA